MKRECDVMYYNKDKEKRNEILKNDVETIKNYIHHLTKNYYFSYINDDENEFKRICDDINDINMFLCDVYPNSYHYILYSMFMNSNNVLKSLFKRDFSLLNVHEVDFEYESDNEFLFDKHSMTYEEFQDWVTISDEEKEEIRKFKEDLGLYD